MTPRARELYKSLGAIEPLGALRDAVLRRLTQDGQSREEVLGDLEDLRADLAENQNVDDEDLVMALMDQMVGFCSPQSNLSKVGQSEFEDPDDE